MYNDMKDSIADQGLEMSALKSYISATGTMQTHVQERNWNWFRKGKRLLHGSKGEWVGLGGVFVLQHACSVILIVKSYLLHVLTCNIQ